MNIVALESAHWPSDELKSRIIDAIQKSARDAELVLPHNTTNVNIIVQPNTVGCISETGCGGRTFDSEFIKIVFDPALPYGVESLLVNLRATVFHEYNHAVRYANIDYDDSFLNHAVIEGLATVFERDFSDTQKPLWGKYENYETMQAWLKEVQGMTFTQQQFDEYTFSHPDGRRWIAYKLGTWIVDEAIKRSNKSVQELTVLPYTEIVKMAQKGDL